MSTAQAGGSSSSIVPFTHNTNHSCDPLPISSSLRLIFTSHAHSPPLIPAPDLKLDLRSFPSPDKQARKAGDGRNTSLQEWLVRVREGVYVGLLDQTQGEVERKGRELVSADRGEENMDANMHRYQLQLVIKEESSRGQEESVLRVGVCCEHGRHRSVAFVEQLSRRKWAQDWTVQVVHRDVDKRRERKGKVKERGKEKDGRG